MNRRRFVQLFAGGIIGTAAALHLPGTLVAKADIGRRSACEMLRRAWLDHYTRTKREPVVMLVGRDLYDAFGDELTANARFVSQLPARDAYAAMYPEHLLFKGGRVHRGIVGGWRITIS